MADLSARERQVVEMIAQDLSQKVIAYRLEISRSAVGIYLMRARKKLGVNKTSALVAKAVELHIIYYKV